MQPEISIIVPFYNVENYIRKCVESILAQSFKDFELILIDDGSPDNCSAICEEYAARDERIKLMHKPNGGLSDARNFGLDVAAGKYIGFIDSDDWITPNMFEVLHREITRHEADIAISCHYSELDGQAERVNDFGQTAVLNNSEAIEEIIVDGRIKSYAWDKLYRRELFDTVRFPVGVTFEDILTTYKLFVQATKVVLVNEPTYYYVKRGDSITGFTSARKLIEKFHAVLEKHEALMKLYSGKIGQPVWETSVNNMIHEGMDLYNFFLREKDQSGSRGAAREVEVFVKKNLSFILAAKNVDLRSKAFALMISKTKFMYNYMYSNFTFLRKNGDTAKAKPVK
ncbi:glycosyltransferase [Paenibacillus sp. HN-1]|uniref:glycosyltransferase family 2 protein n=1 Tax=Paenibacillus TaxID=44249 RepID=UPI001CA8B72B|nr:MULTISPECIES: glycosyltransferase [Paenibacillus]MBY9080233.1 glycosyltransferase [Paenibacillus sp. CGMCC 1.18879]MBY9083108.1 glycosyltransferase [Paenibacillus sinensis]